MSDTVLLAVPIGTLTDEELRLLDWKRVYQNESQEIVRAGISAATPPLQQWQCSSSSTPSLVTRSSAGATYHFEHVQATVSAGPYTVKANVVVGPQVEPLPRSALSKVTLALKRLSVTATGTDVLIDNWKVAIVPEWEGEKHLEAFAPIMQPDKVNRTMQDQNTRTFTAGVEGSANPKVTGGVSLAQGTTNTVSIGAVESESFTCETHGHVQDASFCWELRHWVGSSGRAEPCNRQQQLPAISANVPEPIKDMFKDYACIITPPPFQVKPRNAVHKLATTDGPPGYATWFNVPNQKIRSGEIKWGVYGFVCCSSWRLIDDESLGCLPGVHTVLQKLRNKRVYRCSSTPLGPERWGEIGLKEAS